MDEFSLRLRQARLRRNLGQKTLSERCGLSGNMVGRYERGERVPNALTVKTLCQELDVSADWLLGIKK